MKTKLTIALSILMLMVLTTPSVGNEYYYYSLEGNRVPLTLNDSAVCIKPLGGGGLRSDRCL
jgi:hypothetical protein